MTGPNLSTHRTTADSAADHVADHNAAHQIVNLFDKDASASTGHSLVFDGTLYKPQIHMGVPVASYYPNSSPSAAQQHAALQSACAAASAFGGAVILPAGTLQVVGSFSMSGYSCSIIGQGMTTQSSSSNVPMGSVIECTSQTGPALDFTGFIPPHNFVGRLRFEGFTVKGDGTADSSSDTLGSATVGGGTKKGIFMPSTVYAASLRDLVITNCGGIHLDIAEMYLSDLSAIIVTDPISAATNNVPYVRFRGCNGIRVNGLGIRCLQPGGTSQPADMGTSGAVRLEATAFKFHRSLFSGCWVENVHVPSGAAIIVNQTNCVTHRDWQFFDSYKVSGATGTSCIRLEPSTVGDAGGNFVTGIIEGNYASPATVIDFGVDVTQSWNRIDGVKGYQGANVRLNTAVVDSFIMLGGSEGNATNAAVVDNSGNSSNTIIDATLGLWQMGAHSGSASQTLSGQYVRENRASATLNAAGNANPNLTNGTTVIVYTLASTGIVIAPPSNTTNQLERPFTLILKQDATGSRTVTWNATYAFKAGTAPTLKTAAGSVDTFQFVWDGSLWQQI